METLRGNLPVTYNHTLALQCGGPFIFQTDTPHLGGSFSFWIESFSGYSLHTSVTFYCQLTLQFEKLLNSRLGVRTTFVLRFKIFSLDFSG
jgi:hypothetical protein